VKSRSTRTGVLQRENAEVRLPRYTVLRVAERIVRVGRPFALRIQRSYPGERELVAACGRLWIIALWRTPGHAGERSTDLDGNVTQQLDTGPGPLIDCSAVSGAQFEQLKCFDEAMDLVDGARRRFIAKSGLERPASSVTGSTFDLDWRLRTCDDRAKLQRRPDIGGTLDRRATTGPLRRSLGMTSRFDCSEFPWRRRR
jgi:hypothetical protein